MDNNRLSKSLVRLGALDERPWPALFLNATWTETGRRIVASNLKMSARQFPLAVDQLAMLQRDLSTSTAAHNSARFTGVSPPGMWRKPPQAEK
jgi:3-deoxy-D-manno-octulosonic-acid transferase